MIAFGGGPLDGEAWMRVLYLDESGTGSIEKDPHLVVAGVIIHADKQWHPIASLLRSLLEGATPRGQRVPRFLHAKDVFHGTREFPRETWPEDIRFELLDNIARIPEKFETPIVWSLADRAEFAVRSPSDTALQHKIDSYTTAALACFMQAEWYMRNVVGDREVISITMESNRDLNKRISEIYTFASRPEIVGQVFTGTAVPGLLPLTKVIDEPSFQEKTASSILQLADFCCFALKRSAKQQLHHARFCKPLASAMVLINPGQIPPMQAPRFGRLWL